MAVAEETLKDQPVRDSFKSCVNAEITYLLLYIRIVILQ